MIQSKNIINIRYGLATNSSSTHSIIHNTTTPAFDQEKGEYQWNFFTAASKKEKTRYLVAQLLANIDWRTKEIFLFSLAALDFDAAYSEFENLEVDHQSVMTFPHSKKGVVNLDFFRDYLHYIVDESFIILGGNDNTDELHPLAPLDDNKESFFEILDRDSIAYWNGNYWVVIFSGDNYSSQKKLRIKFVNPYEDLQPERPELIDLKITNFCDLGCSFCYQDSTPSGLHANFKDLKKLITTIMTDENPVEFALGGGEPTRYPEFAELLLFMKERKAIINFTTKNSTWFHDPVIVDAVKNTVSGIAYSIDTVEEFQKFKDLHTKYLYNSRNTPRMYLHLIPEIMDWDKLREIIAEVENHNKKYKFGPQLVNITLLGLKQIGRAQELDRQPHPEILDIFLNTKYTPVGIDTKFAGDYQEYLSRNGIDKKLYTTEEGEFSMYIDAVEEKAYKSSWHLEKPVGYLDSNNWRGYKSIERIFSEIK